MCSHVRARKQSDDRNVSCQRSCNTCAFLTLTVTVLAATSVCATPGRTLAAGGAAALIPGVGVAASTHPVDRSSVRLNAGRVTTRNVGPLAVSVGSGLSLTPGDKRPPGGAAAASSTDTSTFTGDSSAFVSRPSSSSVVFTMSTVGSAGLCDTAADIRTTFSVTAWLLVVTLADRMKLTAVHKIILESTSFKAIAKEQISTAKRGENNKLKRVEKWPT